MQLATVGRFIAALVIPQLAGFIGSLFTMKSLETWYAALKKPTITPPDEVFAWVWTTLFLLMGLSLFMIWSDKSGKPKRFAIAAFATQLALNIGWSAIFFGGRDIGTAFAEILALLAAIVWTVYEFSRINKFAAWLLAPYLAWVSFASLLTYQFWMLNRPIE